MRHLIITALLLASAAPSPCGPKRVVHLLFNHVSLEVVSGVSAGFSAAGVQYCRTHNSTVEHCSERYGSGTGGSIAQGVFTVGMITLSEYGRKHHYKEWFAPSAGALAFNLFWGTRQFTTHEKTTSKP